MQSSARRAELVKRDLFHAVRHAEVDGRADERVAANVVTPAPGSFDIHATEIHHAGRITLIARLLKELARTGMILRNADALVVHHAELRLRVSASLVRGTFEQTR